MKRDPTAFKCAPRPPVQIDQTVTIDEIPDGPVTITACKYHTQMDIQSARLIGSRVIEGPEAVSLAREIRNGPPPDNRRRCPAPDTWEVWHIQQEGFPGILLLAELSGWCAFVTDGKSARVIPAGARSGLVEGF
ncbi:hypothetical protein GCM10009555_047610 [Acrocarpospora macrocephala]|uniref:Uncharacterized protein n=1 Tax=Acrocarpospora macrocephala TaxID=150177 RepID=A0A5M3WV48_9ACTN|nr:hypothetical protein Amac_056990 [Acrocarpospora macrocephala]